MNETRRKPTTGRQSPSLFDKWHGIFYMSSRTHSHPYLFHIPDSHQPFPVAGGRVGPLPITTRGDRTRRVLGMGLANHLGTARDHSQITYTHNHPKSPASRFRQPPTFRSRHTGGAALHEPRPEVHYYDDGYEDDRASVYRDPNQRSHVSRYSRRSNWRNNPTKRRQRRRQGDHHRNGWHGNNRQSPSSESVKHAGTSRNYMDNFGDSNYGSNKGISYSRPGNPHRTNARINGGRHLRTSHLFGYQHSDGSGGHNNGNMLPPGGHHQQKADRQKHNRMFPANGKPDWQKHRMFHGNGKRPEGRQPFEGPQPKRNEAYWGRNGRNGQRSPSAGGYYEEQRRHRNPIFVEGDAWGYLRGDVKRGMNNHDNENAGLIEYDSGLLSPDFYDLIGLVPINVLPNVETATTTTTTTTTTAATTAATKPPVS